MASKGGRSWGGLRTGRTCATPSGVPHCGFPTRRGCRFGWSVGRCSSLWCAAARGRPPSSVPNPRRCAARRPNPQGWSLWRPSKPQAFCTSNATARATPQTFADPGCCRSKSPWCGSLASSCPQARRTTKLQATRPGRRPNRGNAGTALRCRCACGRRPMWHDAPRRWGHRPKLLEGPWAVASRPSRGGGGAGRTPSLSAGQGGHRRWRLPEAQLDVGSWFSRTKEPFFKMGMAVQLLGVKQYFTSSFKFNLRSRRL